MKKKFFFKSWGPSLLHRSASLLARVGLPPSWADRTALLSQGLDTEVRSHHGITRQSQQTACCLDPTDLSQVGALPSGTGIQYTCNPLGLSLPALPRALPPALILIRHLLDSSPSDQVSLLTPLGSHTGIRKPQAAAW